MTSTDRAGAAPCSPVTPTQLASGLDVAALDALIADLTVLRSIAVALRPGRARPGWCRLVVQTSALTFQLCGQSAGHEDTCVPF